MDLTHPLNCVTFNLQRATRSLMRGFEVAAKDSGLTLPQFSTLSLLDGYGQLSVTGMAEKLGTDRTTLSRNLDVLARKGWIEDVPTEDGRLHVWSLTDAGRDKLAVALPVWQQYQAGLVARIGEAQVRSMLEIVAHL
jgi:DNA-binding MarR family transcriptional regulator